MLNSNSIPSAVIDTVAEGVKTSELSFAEMVCGRKVTNKTTLNGTIPTMGSGRSLGRLDDEGLPPGAEPKEQGGEMSSTAYACKAFVGLEFVADEDRNDLAAFGRDEIEAMIRQAKANSNLKLDARLTSRLSSTTLNGEYDCNNDGNGEWDDYTNSTPLTDLLTAKTTLAPMANSFIYGRTTRDSLKSHPDIIAEVSNFSGGSLDVDALNAVIAAKIGLDPERVFYFDKVYNSAAEGQDPVLAYLFDQGAWLGYSGDLILVDPEDAEINHKATVDYVTRRRGHDVQYARYSDIVRAVKLHGATFSNTAT